MTPQSGQTAAATHRNDRPDLRRLQRRTLGVLSAAQIAGGIGVATGAALSSLVVADISGSVAISGFAGTATVLGAALLAIPAAQVAGRSGRRAGLLLAYGLAVIGCLICVGAIALRSWPLLLVGLVLFGGASAGNLAARYSATDLSPPGHAGRHLSLVVWAATIGSVTGPNLADPAEDAAVALGFGGEEGPFALAAVTFALAALIVVAGLRPDPLLVARGTPGDSGTPDGGSGGGAAGPKRTLRGSWRVVRETPDARRALVAIAVSHTAMVSIMSMTPVHLDHGGIGLSIIGVVLSAHIAGMYVFSPLVGWLADRAGAIPVLVVGLFQLLLAAALAASAGPRDVALLSLGLFLLGTGWSCGLVAGSALLSESVAIDHRPSAQGLSDLLMNVCGATGTVVAGVVVAAGSYAMLGVATAVLVVLPAVWLLSAHSGRAAVPRDLR
ncbi:MFS transporter [Sphaerisporangium sp. B11E5]|uniref:MFS transporter n=1 Tax=Sphaerisporangium sp. B11E5 TaxID=3153563 RepID=UPI00325EECB0